MFTNRIAGRLRLGIAGLIPVALTVGALAAAAPVQAQTQVLTQGNCSLHSTWKIAMAYSDGKIDAAFEVDQGKVGVPWTLTLKHNGVIYFQGTKWTLAPDGSFEVDRLITNLAGTDTVKGVAVNPATGETCSGSASL